MVRRFHLPEGLGLRQGHGDAAAIDVERPLRPRQRLGLLVRQLMDIGAHQHHPHAVQRIEALPFVQAVHEDDRLVQRRDHACRIAARQLHHPQRHAHRHPLVRRIALMVVVRLGVVAGQLVLQPLRRLVQQRWVRQLQGPIGQDHAEEVPPAAVLHIEPPHLPAGEGQRLPVRRPPLRAGEAAVVLPHRPAEEEAQEIVFAMRVRRAVRLAHLDPLERRQGDGVRDRQPLLERPADLGDREILRPDPLQRLPVRLPLDRQHHRPRRQIRPPHVHHQRPIPHRPEKDLAVGQSREIGHRDILKSPSSPRPPP